MSDRPAICSLQEVLGKVPLPRHTKSRTQDVVRFWNDAYRCCKKDHKHCVIADPPADVYILKNDSKYQKHSECPCKDDRKVLLYYMVPHVLFDKMVGSEDQHDQHYHAQTGKKDIHPILRKKIYCHVGVFFIDMMMVRMLLCTAF